MSWTIGKSKSNSAMPPFLSTNFVACRGSFERRFLVFFLVTLIVTGCQEHQELSENGGHFAPNEWLAWKWSFPDDHWDPKEFDAAARWVQWHAEHAHDEATRAEGTWTQQGPLNFSGRMNFIRRDDSDPQRMYIGAAAGGLWRTLDGGSSWHPVTEDFGYMAMGSLAIHPDSNEVLYLGTGDPQLSGHPRIGNGIYKSVDGGDSWMHLGLTEERVISQIAIDPFHPQTVFAAAMGNPGLPGPNRGLYRSTDAGGTWEQVLFLGDSIGINDVRISSISGTILATAYHRIRTSTVSDLVSQDNQVYRSTDSGNTWEVVPSPWGEEAHCRIGLEEVDGRFWVHPVGPDYQFSNLYRSTDDGVSWTELVPEGAMPEGILGGFGWYFSKVRVNPWNPNDLLVLGVDLWNSLDGGQTWERLGPEWWTYEVHADKHDAQWIGPESLILATDGGAYRSDDHGATWVDIEDIPVGQFYRVTHIPGAPGWFTAGAQDNGTTTGNASVQNTWSRDRGGDGFTALYHPGGDDLRVSTVQYGAFAYSLTAWDEQPEWNNFTSGIDDDDRKGWNSPIMLHPANPSMAWCGTQRMYRMLDAPFGVWEPVSEDLTLGVEPGLGFRVITTIAGSPMNEMLVAAGTSDGQVWLTQDGGMTWEMMVDGLPARQVTDVAFDPFNLDSMTVTLNGYKDAVYTPHLFRAAVGGTWHDATGDLPDHPINDWRAVNDSSWVVATDFGVYNTTNWGTLWERVGDMPFIPVFELDLDTASGQLVAATFARSIQTFPIDSLVKEAVVIDNPVDTSDTDTLTHGLSTRPGSSRCFLPLAHPFGEHAAVQVDAVWFGGTWTVHKLSGEFVSSGKVEGPRVEWSVADWPSGMYMLTIKSQSGSTCGSTWVKS